MMMVVGFRDALIILSFVAAVFLVLSISFLVSIENKKYSFAMAVICFGFLIATSICAISWGYVRVAILSLVFALFLAFCLGFVVACFIWLDYERAVEREEYKKGIEEILHSEK